MHKFFTPANLFTETHATIEGDDVKHIYKVLRITQGEEVVVNNLEGKEFLGQVEEVNKKEVLVKLLKPMDINNESSLNVYLFQGLPKAAKMDLIVQKGTELGIKEIIPIITDRVDVKLKGEFKKLDRLQRIALEACKQSKRTFIPNVKEPIEFSDMVVRLKEMDLVVVPYENATGYGVKSMMNTLQNKESIKNIGIVIGPEGGFEQTEINNLKDEGAHIVTLGPRILRTETAGFTCLSLLQYELGDIGGKV
ncbi:16S rRNA (uracil1498-N3)-methyltransferase [Clostridium cavendishii DSM 21758]|uniref:Ribosomal RNA small subunit methyltransferase E n=1 Tax=Clostridium cavendishii DSM 21758 TaxID=1121302 RepID=A0A1M6AN03_9CLOT|nr:16S rRNA (uracil(1498)-N(3))-methyltransferase [Clostridium cavendishii]SHI37845.1 16S rRNA (uracil1498-N3)-methyltransferase [Clostridium cavendishii DSM 21758]